MKCLLKFSAISVESLILQLLTFGNFGDGGFILSGIEEFIKLQNLRESFLELIISDLKYIVLKIFKILVKFISIRIAY